MALLRRHRQQSLHHSHPTHPKQKGADEAQVVEAQSLRELERCLKSVDYSVIALDRWVWWGSQAER